MQGGAREMARVAWVPGPMAAQFPGLLKQNQSEIDGCPVIDRCEW